jgi:hypothetical protein
MRLLFVAVVTASLATNAVTAVGSELIIRVVDEKDQPVAGAKVEVVEPPVRGAEPAKRAIPAATTGPAGTVRLETTELPTALFILAYKEGKCADWAIEPVGAKDLTLRLGSAAGIEGDIVDDSGKPVAGATVGLQLKWPAPKDLPLQLDADFFRTKTDDLGHFRFTCLPEGAEVCLDMTAAGHARAWADGHFTPGQKGLRFVLPPEGRLEGAVVDKQTGKPLAEVTVQALGPHGCGINEVFAKTDKDGQFAFRGLAAGKYDVEVVGVGQALPEWIGSEKNVPVENGKAASTKIKSIRGGTLEIALTDSATGKVIAAYASISVLPANRLPTDKLHRKPKEGVARLYLPAGDYIAPEIYIAGFTYRQKEDQSFTVETGKTCRASLALTAVPQVALTVQDSAGKAVAGAQGRIFPLEGAAPRDVVADENGRLVASAEEIGALACLVFVRHPQQNLVALQGVWKDESLPVIKLASPAKVRGLVADAQGHPLAGVPVQARIDHWNIGRIGVIATAPTDKEGRYQLEVPSNFSYLIGAEAPGCGAAEVKVSQNQLEQAQKQAMVMDLVLKAADRKVSGVVKDAHGQRIPGAVVGTKTTGGADAAGAVVTDAQGQFTLEHLSDVSDIRVSVRVPGRWLVGDARIKPGDKELVIPVAPPTWY